MRPKLRGYCITFARMVVSTQEHRHSVHTGWDEIVLNLRTGEFIPAEPVGFWTSGFRWALGHGLAECRSKTRSRKSYWCGRKKLARLSVHGPCTGVHLVCSVQLRTFYREFPYIMMLGLSVRSRLQTILQSYCHLQSYCQQSQL